MSILKIGCCGAYCQTCPEHLDKRCPGCRFGYENGERDIGKAKCRIKICCLKKHLTTCADCGEYASCETLRGFYAKGGYKYRKYREATTFIRKNGYGPFLQLADGWTRQYGKLTKNK